MQQKNWKVRRSVMSPVNTDELEVAVDRHWVRRPRGGPASLRVPMGVGGVTGV